MSFLKYTKKVKNADFTDVLMDLKKNIYLKISSSIRLSKLKITTRAKAERFVVKSIVTNLSISSPKTSNSWPFHHFFGSFP